MKQILTADIGTTATKTALFDESGRTIARAYTEYPVIPQTDYAERDPEDWWHALREGFRQLRSYIIEENLQAVVLGGQMQDLIFIRNDTDLYPAILYYDTRAGLEMEELQSILGNNQIKEITGNIQDASSVLAKLMWMKKNKAEVYRDAEFILFGAHDYAAWRMTGSLNTDFTTASTTGLLDIEKNTWAYQILHQAEIREDWLPGLVRADHYDGPLSESAAAFLGLPAAISVFHGSGDVGTATIGAGAGEPGAAYCYLGTSGWIAAATPDGEFKDIMVDPETGIYNLRHPEPSRLIQVGPMMLAGGNLEWALKEISTFNNTADGYSLIGKAAAGRKPGADGVVFLPYLSGERAPFRDPDARGAFIGISKETKREDIYRSVLEGVAFAMRSIGQRTGHDISEDKHLTLVGGGAKSNLWPQIFSDVFGCKVLVLEDGVDVGLLGSFMLAGKALSWFTDYSLPPSVQQVRKQYIPDQYRQKRYDTLYSIFNGFYPLLKQSFSSLAEYRRKDNSSPLGNS